MKITTSGFIFKFIREDGDEEDNYSYGNFVCENCGYKLKYDYCEIILLLEEANLLPEGFRRLCCMCYFFDKIGILYLRDQYDGWDTEESVLILNFYFGNTIDDSEVLDYDDRILKLRVHDYEKILFS